VVSLVMAWSPFQRANAGIIWVEQPGDYANPIPTTSATGPFSFRDEAERVVMTRPQNVCAAALGRGTDGR
jgi:hypothetical protein